MLIGAVPLSRHEAQIRCAYSGCTGTKSMQTEAQFAGVTVPLEFAGLTNPYFEDAHRSTNNGGDLDQDAVLRVKWNKLHFFTEHPFLGTVTIDMLTERSHGRVIALPRAETRMNLSWIGSLPATRGTAFFPAYNENRLYFRIEMPRFGLAFENEEPVVNGAVIDHVPPLGVEYKLQQPVVFKCTNKTIPISLTLQNCRMAMSLLQDVHLKFTSIEKSGDKKISVVVEALNKSVHDQVRIAVKGTSTDNIACTPAAQFFDLTKEPVSIRFELDASAAMPPGTATVAFVLVKPFESPGANLITFDYEEIVAARAVEGVPAFTEHGLAPTRRL